ncbi:hypothetical protein TNCV_2358611 [Trichonephila clavipes]|nr:hypothetical protein TNCV_2358611 [Trichonephila clavipes]
MDPYAILKFPIGLKTITSVLQFKEQIKISLRLVEAVRLLLEGFLTTKLVILKYGHETKTAHELAPPSPNFHNPATGGRLSCNIFNVPRPLQHGQSSVVLSRTHNTPATSSLP